MEKQYVYIFSISDKPDLIKVGKSSKNPHIRANDLSRNTAATGKFSVEWFMEVPDAELAENIAHFKLKEYHFNKEYFSIKPFDAYLILEKFLIPLFEIKKPVIVYDGKVKALIELRKKSKIANKRTEIALAIHKQSERDERIKNAEKELDGFVSQKRDERLNKFKEASNKYVNEKYADETEKIFQERKKKFLELAKKANDL